jgi:2-methylcitrate dehydratase PrpD
LTDGAVRAKPFHPAKAAQNGLVAASLADSGIEGAEQIFEGEKGFCRFASPNPDFERLIKGLGDPFKIDEVNFKAYPTCGQTHSMLDALGKLIREHAITAKDVKRVEARVYRQAIDVAGKPDPKNLEEAKFSLPFCLAFLLSRGKLTFDNLGEDAVQDSEARQLMKRIDLVYDPEMEAGFPASRPCRIILQSTDGRSLIQENRFRRGDPEDPMDTAALVEKFNQLTRDVLPKEQQKQIVDWCAGLEGARGVEPFLFDRRR